MSYWFDGFNQISKTPPFQNVSVIASEPTNELFTLTTIKNYLKVDVSTDDDLITLIQKSVRKQIENEIGGVQIVRRSVTQKQTGGIEKIELLRGPVNSITSITYYESFDSAGEVIDSAKYRQVNGMLYHETGFWNQGREGDGYVIVFDAGIVADTSNAAEAATPALRMAALRLIAYLYENREEFATTISEGGFSISYNTIVGNSELNNLLMPYAKARAVF
jgi:uncharacterized phiE125 gp8 family phage protein